MVARSAERAGSTARRLGKTVQVITLLRVLFVERKIRTALIVMPTGLIENWLSEFGKWYGPAMAGPSPGAPHCAHVPAPWHARAAAPPATLAVRRFEGMRVKVYHGGAATRERELALVHAKGGVVLTSYGTVRTSVAALSDHGKFTWDYAILDEGHLVKNADAQVSVALRQLPAAHKLLLTGTPIQNNLKELWALFDYVSDGELMGPYDHFRRTYEDPILKVVRPPPRPWTDRAVDETHASPPPSLQTRPERAALDLGERARRRHHGTGPRAPDGAGAPAADPPAFFAPRKEDHLWQRRGGAAVRDRRRARRGRDDPTAHGRAGGARRRPGQVQPSTQEGTRGVDAPDRAAARALPCLLGDGPCLPGPCRALPRDWRRPWWCGGARELTVFAMRERKKGGGETHRRSCTPRASWQRWACSCACARILRSFPSFWCGVPTGRRSWLPSCQHSTTTTN